MSLSFSCLFGQMFVYAVFSHQKSALAKPLKCTTAALVYSLAFHHPTKVFILMCWNQK